MCFSYSLLPFFPITNLTFGIIIHDLLYSPPNCASYSLTLDVLKLDVHVESYSVLLGVGCKMNPCWWHNGSGFFIHFTIDGRNVAMNILVHSPSVHMKVFLLAGKISTCKTLLANGRLFSRFCCAMFHSHYQCASYVTLSTSDNFRC